MKYFENSESRIHRIIRLLYGDVKIRGYYPKADVNKPSPFVRANPGGGGQEKFGQFPKLCTFSLTYCNS